MTIIDRRSNLKNWPNLLMRLVLDKRLRKIVAYSNNHYCGHAPATMAVFQKRGKKL